MIEHADKENRAKVDRMLNTSAVRSDGTPDWYDPEEDGEMDATEEAQVGNFMAQFSTGD